MKVLIKISDKEIENLKPWLDEIRYHKGVELFVREYDKVYKDLIRAKMLNK
jgi:hypothetical protein